MGTEDLNKSKKEMVEKGETNTPKSKTVADWVPGIPRICNVLAHYNSRPAHKKKP